MQRTVFFHLCYKVIGSMDLLVRALLALLKPGQPPCAHPRQGLEARGSRARWAYAPLALLQYCLLQSVHPRQGLEARGSRARWAHAHLALLKPGHPQYTHPNPGFEARRSRARWAHAPLALLNSKDPPTTQIYTLSLHDAPPILLVRALLALLKPGQPPCAHPRQGLEARGS